MRAVSERELCHERLGEKFESALSEYDTQRRLEVLIDQFLPPDDVAGRSVLDVGCGLGHFSERLAARGADVTACDLGEDLVRRTIERAGCRGVQADCLMLTDVFGPESFDAVVSSECIEHTPDPQEALRQMAAVLKPGGLLAVSTPNRVWQPVVRAATALKLRPFDGLENFSTWTEIRNTLRAGGIEVLQETGLHLFPFQLRMHGLSRWCDGHLQFARGCMINICILGRKTARSAEH
jgi:2-polyprenyl-6-hydroxyphenyl methylase/3-demethylubiquinone-9 3-methyltransferase